MAAHPFCIGTVVSQLSHIPMNNRSSLALYKAYWGTCRYGLKVKRTFSICRLFAGIVSRFTIFVKMGICSSLSVWSPLSLGLECSCTTCVYGSQPARQNMGSSRELGIISSFCAQHEELCVTGRAHSDREVLGVPLLWAWKGASSQANLHPLLLTTEKHGSELHPLPSSCFLEQVFPKSDISLLLSAVITESSFSFTVLFKGRSIFIPYSYRCSCGYSQSLPFADKLAALFSGHQAAGIRIPSVFVFYPSSLFILQIFCPGGKLVTHCWADAELCFCSVVREVSTGRKGPVQAWRCGGEGEGWKAAFQGAASWELLGCWLYIGHGRTQLPLCPQSWVGGL
ncbi:uncharacterized protein LOC116654041 [Coturnix japonica]|uniref:uncharacterized protein LOC116654041 n=1 Tax=Coturnix japonica TaxID=93934 RepID=UPI0013A5E301|nr:uncharacterized protein LOC116654041 [Coturnix japonica]